MKIQSDLKKPLIEREINTVMICFNEKEVEVNGVLKYEYDSIRTTFPYTYSSIVSAIINERYSSDDMQAIINNHLEGLHELEYLDMQEYRRLAKEIARQITT